MSTAEPEPRTPTWLIVVLVLLTIVGVIVFWHQILFVIAFLGMWPIARVLFGGASFWFRH